MLYIYVLKLDGNKYYVGKTTNPDFRLDTHFDVGGSAWTIKYKPIKLIELIGGCDIFDEDKYTLKYMEKYGIENVRGGSFCEINFNQENINTINKMIINSSKLINNNNNNLQETNNEIIKLEIQYEYSQLLKELFNIICYHIKKIENQDLINMFDHNLNYRTNGINFNSIFVIMKNNNQSYNIICNKFLNNLLRDVLVKNLFEKIKNNFAKHIDDACINYYAFVRLEKLNLNLNIKMNKILLLKLQLEKELERIYKIHQVDNFSLYELEVNKKMELLTSRMIELTIQI